MKPSTLADIAAAAAIALLMTAPDAMAAPVHEQAATGPSVGFTCSSTPARTATSPAAAPGTATAPLR